MVNYRFYISVDKNLIKLTKITGCDSIVENFILLV